jgi:DNA topoisomerase-2
MNELAKQYQKKTDKQHILDNPDTYIGSVETVETNGWLLKDGTISKTNFTYIPGLYKLFDEGIVNCRDHVVRMNDQITLGNSNFPVTYIKISIDNSGVITMINDGDGIDIAKHPEYNIWIPEMIFGHLRTSTNYDKTTKKIVGGKNGFGFKLVLIWSTWGSIETVDHTRKLKYVQTFGNNLDERSNPVITKCNKKPYTKISFRPDYTRLGISGLTDEMLNMFQRRVYDIAAITNKKIKVSYNGELVPIKHFQQYVDLYIGEKSATKRVYYESNNGRWEIVACNSPYDEFTHVSFVNGIFTNKGGRHVEYITNQIIRKITKYIKAKKKIDVSPTSIKEQLMIFIRCDIENPAFDSQTKDYLNTPVTKFGSTCVIADSFIEKLAKLGIMEVALSLTEIKTRNTVQKSDGRKDKTIRGIPKLIDANYAGTSRSVECTLILCEGDSAKAGIVSGLSREDRNTIGVYPLKGKLLNTRGENMEKISNNKEISEIKQILGLKIGEVYDTVDSVNTKLRYSKLLFMTDQDLDGSHIKALGINLFQSEWGSLVRIPGFLGFMNTPIIKASKGKKRHIFYNESAYEQWRDIMGNLMTGWNIKYYKGLGTSTGKEFKEYFRERKTVDFSYTDKCDNTIDMVFNKKRAEDRKEWLSIYNRHDVLDATDTAASYTDFINLELKHFSKYDNARSIPNVVDGLKTSLRKILFAAVKKKLVKEIKVAQFSGYVSENTGYHHGEASLNAAIKGMAQNYVGSNNINLLMPNGQFGTRLLGGKDSASERYIFTQLNALTRLIYPEADDIVLEYQNDDGQSVEPIYYCPIIPMILVNGTKGIGTGFSTDVPCYNPRELAECIRAKLRGENTDNLIDRMCPYYHGFRGTINKLMTNKYIIKGCYTKVGPDTIQITELPIGCWTSEYKQFLENNMMTDGKRCKKSDSKKSDSKKAINIVKDYVDLSTDTVVDFTITLQKGWLAKLEKEVYDGAYNGIEKMFKLFAYCSTSNMHLFDECENLKKYETIRDIIDEYFAVRMKMYELRKKHLIDIFEKELVKISNKVRYIRENLVGTIDLRNKTKQDINSLLNEKNYSYITTDTTGTTETTNINLGFHYLIKMTMDSVSAENVQKLEQDMMMKTDELMNLRNTSTQQLWLNEVGAFIQKLDSVMPILTINNINKTTVVPKTSKIPKSSKAPKSSQKCKKIKLTIRSI